MDSHQLERRADGLAQAIARQVDNLSQFLAPKGKRPPFTEILSKPRALAFWQEHINDQYGAKILKQMNPLDVIELHQALQGAEAEPEEVEDPMAYQG